MPTIETPAETADSMLDLQPSGTTTLYLGTATVFNISPEHVETIRAAIIRGIERDRAQRSVVLSAAVEHLQDEDFDLREWDHRKDVIRLIEQAS